MKKVVVLLDYLGTFSSRYTGNQGVNLKLLEEYFLQRNIAVIYKSFFKVNFREENYKDVFILYQSSEDLHDKYKNYIDNILYGLKLKGAILVPDYLYFKAHQNKVFMEIVRDLAENDKLKNIYSKYYGTYEEYIADLKADSEQKPLIFKSAWGSGSLNIVKLENISDKIEIPKRLSETREYVAFWQYLYSPVKPFYQSIKRIFKKKMVTKVLLKESNNREKFIVQNFIEGLSNDYKILIFGKKFYVLFRHNRKNDFRASGSGNFVWIEEPQLDLLDFAESVFNSFESPYLSIDVAEKAGIFYLFEFQFIMFGTLTMEESKFYFQKVDGLWEKVVEKPILEREIAQSVTEFINTLKIK